MPTERRIERLKTVLRHRQLDLTVVCENIHDPHNVSAILRSCDAAGVQDVHLLYTEEQFPKLGKKSSASAKKWLNFHKHRSYTELKETLHRQNMQILATAVRPDAENIYDIDFTLPTAIVVGNEHRGVSDEMLEIADKHIYIPMQGIVESLNVSVATAVILFEAVRQRREKKKYPSRNDDDTWLLHQLDAWLEVKK